MSQGVAFRGRLPGVRSDPSLARVIDDSIRLDVAGFVGFAERGPVDDPQPIEDPDQYERVFGGDLSLAIDDRGVPIHAALPDAVRSFFDNGGRRAHVVRVVGDGAVTAQIPARVTSRIPLGGGHAVTAVGVAPPDAVEPLDATAAVRELAFVAASPGGWASTVSADVDVIDTVLALATDVDGVVDLTSGSRRLIDEGDALLVRRFDTTASPPADHWLLLRVPAAVAQVAPPGGWRPTDVARLLRADLTVRVAGRDGARAVERFRDLRLGVGPGRSTSWTDVVQPADGRFRSDASMYLRATTGTAIVAVVGSGDLPIPPAPAPDVPAAASREALRADGLEDFGPVGLFLDDSLTGQTVDGLRLALEVLGLDDSPRARGVHALALVPEVAIVAVPDLYHRPWHEQSVLRVPRLPGPPHELPLAPVDFHPCAASAVPEPTPPEAEVAPAVDRMVADPPSAYDSEGLHTVATAVADLCAARADMVAVLGLPRHAGVADAEQLADIVSSRRAAGPDVGSYVGIWHPWGAIVERRSPSLAPLRSVPPDGSIVGCIASTELTRGVWTEPAGNVLAGILAVDRIDADTESEAALALFDRGLNVLRRRPGGFAATSAHSVSSDRAFLQLSVRRLLISVRKLALREGLRFVFEPDDERFRVQAAATFRRFLERLRLSGALAAYQVDIESLTERSLADEGVVRLDLKLAPTSPIEFITVSLLRSGDGLLTIGGL